MSSFIKMQGVDLLLPVVSKVDNVAETGQAPIGGEIVKKNGRHYVHALRDINIDIAPGDRVGLVGHNGAGKTTLMRMMCGIFQPTKGACKINGRVSTLFSSTIGMDNNATGLENIKFALSLYGVPQSEHESHIKDIAAFSELGDYLNFPIRTYSAGMRTRLGFSVVTSVQPDILIIDEVLTTGDKEFAEKAKSRIIEFAKRASILIVASHSPALLSLFCTRAIWMNKGKVKDDGDFYKVMEAYSADEHAHKATGKLPLKKTLLKKRVQLLQDKPVPSVVNFEREGQMIKLHTGREEQYAKYAGLSLFFEDDFLEYTRALGLGGTYLDININVANHSVFWGLFSKANKIVGLESSSVYQSLAAENISANQLSDTVKVLPYTAAGVTDRLDSEKETVNARRIDIDQLDSVDNVSLVRVDVEGMELETLGSIEALLTRDRPIVYCKIIQGKYDIKYNADALIKFMESVNYKWTGRVFNYNPTLEFWPKGKLNMVKSEKTLKEWNLNPNHFIPSNFTGFVQSEGDNSAIFHLDASPKVFFARSLDNFSLPAESFDITLSNVNRDGDFFLEVGALPVGDVRFSVIINQYDDEKFLKQNRILCERRKTQKLDILQESQQIRVIIEAKGTGFIDIQRLIITQVYDNGC